MPRALRLFRVLVCGLLLLAAAAVASAAPEQGFPLIQTYEPSLREASTQSFGVTRDPRGVLYFANANGVLIYDGAWWRLIGIGHAKTAFAVESDESGRIGVGGIDELGYLEPDATGTLRYVSLLHLLPPERRRFGQVMNLVATPDGFAFLTEQWLALWDGKSLATIATFPGDRPYTALFQWGRETRAWTRDGLFRLAGRKLEPVPGGDQFRGRRVDVLLPADGGLLVSVRGEGLFLLAQGRATPFAPEASRWAVAKRLISGVRLPDGRWALGSVLGGLLLLRPDGEIDQVIDTAVGLPDDFVSGMLVDPEGALWLALDLNLVRVQVASPITVIDRRLGLPGGVRQVVRHGGDLWAATAVGIFSTRRDIRDTGPEWLRTTRMSAVPGMPSSGWSLLSAGEDLLAGTAFGVWRARGASVQAVPGTEQKTVYFLGPSPSVPGRVWMGMSDGLAALRRGGAEWRLEGVVKGIPGEVRYAVEGEKGFLWCSVWPAGLFRVELPSGWPNDWPNEKPRLRQIVDGGQLGLSRIGDRILVTRDGRVLRLDEATGALVADPALAGLGSHGPLTQLVQDAQGNLWMNTQPPSVAWRQGTGWSPNLRSLVDVTSRTIESIYAEPDGSVWLAGENGLLKYAGISKGQGPPLPAPLLASMTAGGRRLFGGAPGATPARSELSADVRRLRIEFAPLSFRAGLRYQTRLDPEDASWNAPSPEPFAELTRLPPGRYTFRVRTVGPSGEVGPETAWSFRVLPPWYLTPWALALWTGAAFLGIWGYVRLRGRALQQRATLLEARVSEQTVELRNTVAELSRAHAELAAANVRLQDLSLTDELTGIANRRRLQQVLEDEWSRARRHGTPVAFILLDLDYFKLLNDTRGHAEGDLCLQTVGSFLAAAVERTGDLAARYGGEELAVLLPDTGLAGALLVAEHLRQGIESLALPHDASPLGRITASFGVAAVIPSPGQSPDVLIEAADFALYRAKTEGRNRVRAGNVEGETADLEIVTR